MGWEPEPTNYGEEDIESLLSRDSRCDTDAETKGFILDIRSAFYAPATTSFARALSIAHRTGVLASCACFVVSLE